MRDAQVLTSDDGAAVEFGNMHEFWEVSPDGYGGILTSVRAGETRHYAKLDADEVRDIARAFLALADEIDPPKLRALKDRVSVAREYIRSHYAWMTTPGKNAYHEGGVIQNAGWMHDRANHGQSRGEWCNCQAIPGTENYPGPWHERGGEPHYPCAIAARRARQNAAFEGLRELLEDETDAMERENDDHWVHRILARRDQDFSTWRPAVVQETACARKPKEDE